MLEKAFSYFTDHFEPAKSNIPVEYLSTGDIIQIIKPMAPEFKFDSFLVNDLLKKHQFKEAPDPIDNKLRWKVVKK